MGDAGEGEHSGQADGDGFGPAVEVGHAQEANCPGGHAAQHQGDEYGHQSSLIASN